MMFSSSALVFPLLLLTLFFNEFAAAAHSMPKLNAVGTEISSKHKKTSELAEEAKNAFKQMASYQDFLYFTINGKSGVPFLREDYLHFHDSQAYWQREQLFAQIHANTVKAVNDPSKLEALIGEYVDLSSIYSEEEAAAWREQYKDWARKLHTTPAWFKLREYLLLTDRTGNRLIAAYCPYIGFLASKPIEPFEMVTKYGGEGEPNYAQTQVELALSAEMIAKEQKLWAERVQPHLAQFMQLEKREVASSDDGNGLQQWQQHSGWQLIAQMHAAIQDGLKSKVDEQRLEVEKQKAQQMKRILQKYLQKFEQQENAKQQAAEQFEQQRHEHDSYMQAQLQGLAY